MFNTILINDNRRNLLSFSLNEVACFMLIVTVARAPVTGRSLVSTFNFSPQHLQDEIDKRKQRQADLENREKQLKDVRAKQAELQDKQKVTVQENRLQSCCDEL